MRCVGEERAGRWPWSRGGGGGEGKGRPPAFHKNTHTEPHFLRTENTAIAGRPTPEPAGTMPPRTPFCETCSAVQRSFTCSCFLNRLPLCSTSPLPPIRVTVPFSPFSAPFFTSTVQCFRWTLTSSYHRQGPHAQTDTDRYTRE